jgi:hypothetical protein
MFAARYMIRDFWDESAAYTTTVEDVWYLLSQIFIYLDGRNGRFH